MSDDVVRINKSVKMRVWHIPQVPGKAFHVSVKDRYEAQSILRMLWDYDLFQYEHKIKPDYSNASGLEVFEDGEWLEWEDEETGDTIDDCMRAA